jgi:hypothetical protein
MNEMTLKAGNAIELWRNTRRYGSDPALPCGDSRNEISLSTKSLADVVFDEFSKRLRETQEQCEALGVDRLAEAVPKFLRIVGLTITAHTSSAIDVTSVTSNNFNNLNATKHALLSICKINNPTTHPEAALASLARLYLTSEDRELFTADGILGSARDFFSTVAEQTVSFEDLIRVLLLVTFIRSKGNDNIGWDEVKNGVSERFYDALVDHLLSFQGGYLCDQDLKDLGIPDRCRGEVIAIVSKQQLLGEVKTRQQALRATLDQIRTTDTDGSQVAPDDNLESIEIELLKRTGSDVDGFVLRREEAGCYIREAESGANYKIFRCWSRRQFSREAIEREVEYEISHSGNYPAIVRELRLADLTYHDVISKMKGDKIFNLPELENFCESLAWRRQNIEHAANISLRHVDWITSSRAVFAEVSYPESSSKVRSITLGLGYQGADHEGTGVTHVIRQRVKDAGFRQFVRAEESDDDAVERFIRDGVLHIAGADGLRLPSGRAPSTHLLLSGMIAGTDNQFITLVLGRMPDADGEQDENVEALYLVTALFHKNKAAMRQTIKRELSGWVEYQKEHGTFNDKLFQTLLKNIGTFCERYSIATILSSEIIIKLAKSDIDEFKLSASSEEADEETSLWDLGLDRSSSSEDGRSYEFAADDSEEIPGLGFITIPTSLNRRGRHIAR